MVKFILGVLFGFTITAWYLAFDFKFDFDHAFTLNLVIAAATLTATAIHFDTVQKQKRYRVWEINKESLITLSKSIADAIEISSNLSEREFNRMNNIPDDSCIEGAYEINNKFKETISDSLNVYKPLLNKELIDAIKKYQENEKRIVDAYNHDELSVFEAYENQLAAQEKLQKVISHFIKDVAGI